MTLNQDTEIIKLVLGGNTDAFGSLVVKYQNKTYGFCYKLLKDEDKATEAAHLSFVKAYENLGRLRMDSSFSTWFYRIAYNICLDQLRYDKKMVRTSETDPDEEWAPHEINAGMDYLSNEERKKYLDIALQKLSPVEKVLIFNYYEEEMSINELSEITEFSPANVKIRLFRARKKLYKNLETLLKDEVASLLR
jgi:RNA polymerase sigma-70 factor (ECF subfamily)